MGKIIVTILVCILLTSNLFAGGGTHREKSGSPIEITFWDENPGPERTPHLEQIIKWYHESQNKIQVKYVGVPQDQAVDKLNIAIAGKAVPDVTGMHSSWISGFIAQNALLKLDDVFSSWDENKYFDQGVINAVRLRDLNGGLFMLPARVSYNCIWYRIDRFKELGLEVPNNWDDFFDDIKKLTDPGKNQYGWSMRGGSGSGTQLTIIMFAYSGNKEYFDKDGVATLRDPAMLEFLTKFAGLYNKYTGSGDVNYNYQAMVAAFDSGVANMIQHNLGSLGEHQKSLQPGTFGTIFFPKSIRGYYCSTIPSPDGYSICTGVKNEMAAIDFLKFIGSKRAVSFWNEKIGEFPP
ncbi:MAG: sugar ABC transporter substrate-binding protein, partial [Treponema sp.]|nr:sugar ABC transporter substrate-binding protein [Treponema sp.]